MVFVSRIWISSEQISNQWINIIFVFPDHSAIEVHIDYHLTPACYRWTNDILASYREYNMSAILLSAVISVVVIIIFQLLIKLLRVKYAYHGLPEPLEDKHWLLGHLPIVSIFHHGFSYIGFHLFISPSFCNSFCVILPWFPSDSPNVYKRIRLNSP